MVSVSAGNGYPAAASAARDGDGDGDGDGDANCRGHIPSEWKHSGITRVCDMSVIPHFAKCGARLGICAYRRIAGTSASHFAEDRSPLEEKAPETGAHSSTRPFYSASSSAAAAHITAISPQNRRPYRDAPPPDAIPPRTNTEMSDMPARYRRADGDGAMRRPERWTGSGHATASAGGRGWGHATDGAGGRGWGHATAGAGGRGSGHATDGAGGRGSGHATDGAGGRGSGHATAGAGGRAGARRTDRWGACEFRGG